MRIYDPSDLLDNEHRAELEAMLHAAGGELLRQLPSAGNLKTFRLYSPDGGFLEFATGHRAHGETELVLVGDANGSYTAAEAAAYDPNAATRHVRAALDAYADARQRKLF